MLPNALIDVVTCANGYNRFMIKGGRLPTQGNCISLSFISNHNVLLTLHAVFVLYFSEILYQPITPAPIC